MKIQFSLWVSFSVSATEPGRPATVPWTPSAEVGLGPPSVPGIIQSRDNYVMTFIKRFEGKAELYP